MARLKHLFVTGSVPPSLRRSLRIASPAGKKRLPGENSMKALLSKVVGGPESLVLEDLPSPTAKPGFAVVSVKAVGVNYPDVLIIEDKYQFKPARPFAPGGEVSGVVKEVGEGVTHVKPGDRVLGNTGWGGMAEELALEASRLIPI